MILSQSDLRKAIEEKKIIFSPKLDEEQFGEASIDLRLGFLFTIFTEDLIGVKVSVAENGVTTIGSAGFFREKNLKEIDELGQPETFTIHPGKFRLGDDT